MFLSLTEVFKRSNYELVLAKIFEVNPRAEISDAFYDLQDADLSQCRHGIGHPTDTTRGPSIAPSFYYKVKSSR